MRRTLRLFFSCLFLLSLPVTASSQPTKPALNLNQLIEEALENNPEILAAKKRGEVYREKVPQASALEDPMLEFGIVNLPTNFSFRDEDMTMKEIGISQKLPFPGKRPLMREMASKEAEAVSTEIEEKVNRIIKEVKAVYYDLSHVYQTIEVAQRNKKILEDFAKIAETRYAVGEGIQQDVFKAQVEIFKLLEKRTVLEQKRSAAVSQINSLAYRSPGTAMGQPSRLQVPSLAYSLEQLNDLAQAAFPELQVKEREIERNRLAVELARAADRERAVANSEKGGRR